MSTPTTHDASPEAAIAALRAFRGPLLLDLDETLYLRNTTEDFIDSARPGVAAAMLMVLLDWIKPWRWTGGAATRDVWRVRLVTILFPWTPRLWRRRIPGLVEQYANMPLLKALRAHGSPPIIVTLGFSAIVTPLVAEFALGEVRIIATDDSGFHDRRRGKLAMAQDALGDDTVRRGLVITDSSDDLPLLDACARPLRTCWPGARYRHALDGIYLPGRYLSRIKRPGERYIVRGVLQEDFAFWLLCSVSLAASPLRHAIGLLFLLLSFWAIYECGYVDNDRVANRLEADPKLSPAFYTSPVATPPWQPWLWALASGFVAILLLRWPQPAGLVDIAAWVGVLLVTYGWFHLYNRFNKPTRVWFYPGLQFARSAAFVVLVPVVAPIGTLALGAHVMAKWLPYYVYRNGNTGWPEFPLGLTRLLFFVLLAALLGATQGAAGLLNWTALALFGWILFRAHDDLRSVVSHARRLDRPQRSQPS